MGALDFKGSGEREKEDAGVVAYNTSVGVWLFLVYVLIYGGFMALAAFRPDVMKQSLVLGLNVAVVYGLVLIVSALAIALVYMKMCRK